MAGVLLSALEEGVVVLDRDKRLLHANDAATRILGIDLHLSRGQDAWWEPLSPRLASDGSELDVGRQILEHGGEARGVEVALDVHGEQRRLSLNYVPVMSGDGNVIGLVVSFRDVNELELQILEMGNTQEQLREAHETARLASWEWRPDTNEVLVFQALAESETPAQSLISLEQWLARVPAAEHSWVISDFAEYRSGERHEAARRFRYEMPTGPIWLEVRSHAIRDDAGRLLAVRGTAQDVSGQELAEQRLREASDFFQGTLDSLAAHVAVLDEDGTVILTNRAWNDFAEANGGTPSGAGPGLNYLAACDTAADEPGAVGIAASLRAIISGEQSHFTAEYPCHGPDVRRWYRMTATRYEGDVLMRVVVAHEDISARVEGEHALQRAYTDLRALTDNMGEGVLTVERSGQLTYVNRAAIEMVGWHADETQREGLHPLLSAYGPSGSPAQGNESQILAALDLGEAIRVDDDVFMCSDGSLLPVSYVATPFTAQDGTEGCVVVFQDIADQKAKQRLVEIDLDKLAWVTRVEEALRNDLFVLHAQPIVELATGDTVQHELLIRMREVDNTDSGLIAPGSFLPVAEEFGLITEIDRWVIDRAAEIAGGGVPVELNVSGRSIGDAGLLDHIEAAIERTGADPRLMVFEITETTMVSSEVAARRFVEHLHGLGCKIALDDFGTGYGGFTYVKQLPIDYLKIDIEFVRDLVETAASRNVVQAIVKLAQGFGLRTVAEGVEDEKTRELLQAMGVDYAQGYLVGRPRELTGVFASAKGGREDG